MKDFSHWKEYEGASEGSGRSEKQWLINPVTKQTGLFKFKKDSKTTDHASECIASDLANIIGIPCACFEIGMFQGREGSMSYNIVKHEGMALIEGIYCISKCYNSFDVEKLVDVRTGEKYSLQMIKKALEEYGLFEDFLPILVFDFLIGNTDRHIAESKIDRYFGRDRLLWQSLADSKSRSLIRIEPYDKRLPTHAAMLRFLKANYFRQTDRIANQIEELVTQDRICDILNKYSDVLSEKKKLLIMKYLLSKIEIMLDVYR